MSGALCRNSLVLSGIVNDSFYSDVSDKVVLENANTLLNGIRHINKPPSNFYCWPSQGGSSVLVLW